MPVVSVVFGEHVVFSIKKLAIYWFLLSNGLSWVCMGMAKAMQFKQKVEEASFHNVIALSHHNR